MTKYLTFIYSLVMLVRVHMFVEKLDNQFLFLKDLRIITAVYVIAYGFMLYSEYTKKERRK